MERDPKSAAAVVDLANGNGHNSRLIDPSLTPEKLKSIHFGIGVPCPTRTMTRETGMALRAMAFPMFANPAYYSPDSLEVGEARNQIVEMALADGCDWLLFVDYDVAPPAHALRRLLALDVPIAAGVYHSKEVPSYPLIFVKGWPQSFEDYDQGDLIKADGVGMGCTLIKAEVFRKIEKELGKPWFKTVGGTSDDGRAILPAMTEDIYFCEKAREVGYDIIVDTGVQAMHVDWRTGMIFHYVPGEDGKRGKPGWTYRVGSRYVTETLPGPAHPNRAWAKTSPPPPETDGPLRIDLGSGILVAEGFTGVDLYAEAPNVIKGDISDLAWFRSAHGFADEIRASHCLEHFGHREVEGILRDWVNTLKPGGTMTVIVPSVEQAARKLIEVIEKGEDVEEQSNYYLMMMYGYQRGEGQIHKTGFTRLRLLQMGRAAGLEDAAVEVKQNQGGGWIADNEALVLTGRRPGGTKDGYDSSDHQ